MPNTELAKIPYPSGLDAPAAAADMMSIVTAIDPKLVHPAIDEADRNNRYGDAPVSTIVGSGESKKVWMKTGPASTDWMEVYGDTGEVTEGFTFPKDWSKGSYCFCRKWGPIVEVCAEVIYGGSTPITDTGAPGNITPDFDIIYIPAQFASQVGSRYREIGWSSVTSAGHGFLYGSGRVTLRDIHPGGSINPGDFVRFAITFLN